MIVHVIYPPSYAIVHIFLRLIDEAKLENKVYLFVKMLINSSNFIVDTTVQAFQKRYAPDLLLQSYKKLLERCRKQYR